MELPEREQAVWSKISAEAGVHGVPQAVCSTIRPFPFWAVIVPMVVFIPLALIASIFVSRQAIVVQGEEIAIYELSFWRLGLRGEAARLPLASTPVALSGQALVIESRKYHLQPGWRETAERIVALAPAGVGA